MAKQLDPNAMSRLQSVMGKSLKLIEADRNGTLDKIAKAHKDGIGSDLLNEGSEMSAASLMTTTRNRKTDAPIVNRNNISSESKLPSAILESFRNNPIDESALYTSMGGGSDDSLDFLMEGINREVPRTVEKPTQEVRNIINESMHPQQPMSQGIDYPMIRTIVEDIVRKYATSLNKKIISEGKQSTNEINTIALGKTFKFLSNDGTIYECTMKKVGNIKNKKSVNE